MLKWVFVHSSPLSSNWLPCTEFRAVTWASGVYISWASRLFTIISVYIVCSGGREPHDLLASRPGFHVSPPGPCLANFFLHPSNREGESFLFLPVWCPPITLTIPPPPLPLSTNFSFYPQGTLGPHIICHSCMHNSGDIAPDMWLPHGSCYYKSGSAFLLPPPLHVSPPLPLYGL